MYILLKQRRLFVTLVIVLCFIYTSHLTIQIFTGLNQRHDCGNSHDHASARRLMSRSLDSDDDQPSMSDGVKRGRETLKEIALDKNRKYRLDLIEADIAGLAPSESDKLSDYEKEERTDYFGCKDFDRIPRTRKEVEENLRGNRGISFIKVRIDGVTIPAVMKEANRLYRTVIEEYKYNSAMREIMYLSKLRGLRGIPRMLGSCVEELRVRYIVERVNGVTLCNDNGTTLACAAGNHIMEMLKEDPNPQLAAISFAYSTATFFQQLEERHLFMEDVSGLNFMVTGDWQLYMVDADSLVFYNDTRIYSQVSCNADDHCPSPSGNLWVEMSLNVRIYSNCRDLTGICEDNQCRGFGTELHACGLAQWYMCRLNTFLPRTSEAGKAYREVCLCMREMFPHKRCTFRRVADIIRNVFKIYLRENGNNLQTQSKPLQIPK